MSPALRGGAVPALALLTQQEEPLRALQDPALALKIVTESRHSLCLQMDFLKDKISKDNAKLHEFTFLLPQSMSNHGLGTILDSLAQLPCQSRAGTEPAPSLMFVKKPKTWGIWGCLFQTFQTVPVTSSGEQTPANGSSLTEKSHYPLFSFNPLGNSFLLKKTLSCGLCAIHHD